MVKLTVMYPNTQDTKFDLDYYATTHKTMLLGLLGEFLVKAEMDKGIAGGAPGEPAPYVVISHLIFDSIDSFEKSFVANTEKILADLPNFTNVRPEVQLSEISE